MFRQSLSLLRSRGYRYGILSRNRLNCFRFRHEFAEARKEAIEESNPLSFQM